MLDTSYNKKGMKPWKIIRTAWILGLLLESPLEADAWGQRSIRLIILGTPPPLSTTFRFCSVINIYVLGLFGSFFKPINENLQKCERKRQIILVFIGACTRIFKWKSKTGRIRITVWYVICRIFPPDWPESFAGGDLPEGHFFTYKLEKFR